MVSTVELLKPRSRVEVLQFVAILALSIFPILPYAAVSIILIIFSLSSLFLAFNSKEIRSIVVIQIGFYLMLILSLLYSKEFMEGVKSLKASVVLLVFPALVLLYKNTFLVKNLRFVYLGYVLANLGLIYVLYSFFLNGIITDRFPNLIEEGIWAQLEYLWSYPFEFVLSKSLKDGSSWFMNHKTILALNFLIAALFSLKLFFEDFKSTYFKYFLLAPVFLFIICVVYTQALVNVALLPILLIYIILKIEDWRKRLVTSIAILMIGLIVFVKLDVVEAFDNGNTKSVKTMVISLVNGEISQDSDPRLFIYYCDLDLMKTKFLTGFGVGDVQNQLNQCYAKNQFEAKYNKERIFNSHNYYAHLVLSAGVVALLLFVFLVLYNLGLAWKNKDIAFLLFVLIFIVNLLTDNILLRFQGALCFALFNSLFLVSNLKLGRGE